MFDLFKKPVAPVIEVAAVDPKEEIKELQEKIEALRGQLSEQERIETLQIERDELEKDVIDLKFQINETKDRLSEEKRKAKDVQEENKRSEREIAHNVKIDQERREIEFEKKVAKLEREHQEAISGIQKEHMTELNRISEESMKRAEERFEQILSLVPGWKGKVSATVAD